MRHILIIAIMVVPAVAGGLAAAQKPIQESQLFVDSAPPPAGPVAMADAASAVVIAKYSGQSRTVRGDFGPPETEYTFMIAEILKLDAHLPLVGGELPVRLIGGDSELATHIERQRVRGVRPLIEGDSYLLYLNWNIPQDRFVPAWGPRGIFDVSDGVVTSLDSRAPEHDGTRTQDFVRHLRNLR